MRQAERAERTRFARSGHLAETAAHVAGLDLYAESVEAIDLEVDAVACDLISISDAQ
jgi:hypothetical protein